MRIEELAELMGKTRGEVEELLKAQDVVELKLSERKTKARNRNDELKIFEH